MAARSKRYTKTKASGSPVKFPPAVTGVSKLNDAKLASRLAAHEAAVRQAEALDSSEVLRSGQADAVLAGMRRSVESVEALRSEREFRAETARLDRRGLWDSLRGAPSPKERWEAHEAAERQKAEARKAQRAELERRRAEEAQARRTEQVRAGLIYEPVGGWDFAGIDALAAVFSSPWLWEALDKRHPDGAAMTVHDLGFLHVVLCLISENGGEEVRVRVDRFPRLPEEFHGDRSKVLEHLCRNDLLAVDRNGVNVKIRRGPRVEALRRSYREQMLERALDERVGS